MPVGVVLWALGVAAVISGDFSGWNFGLATGGFGGLLVATVLMAIMYVCMVLCIAELSTALPYAGGFYSFTRSAMGPSMAFVNTVTDIVEYVVTPAVVVISIAAYADNIVDLPNWIWWVGFYALFVGINMWGTKLSFRVSFIAAILAMGVLVFFYLAAIFSGAWSPDLLNNVPVDSSRAGASTFLPLGWFGVLASFPFAIWFYLAIEQLPLAAEESTDIVRDMPKALIWGIVTLLGFSVFTLVFNTGIAGGAAEVGSSLEPVMLGFRAIFGDGIGTTFLAVLALVGLIASFHAIIYAYGRVLFAGSRAGYLPRSISVTSARHTPARALLLGGVVGLGLAFLIDAYIDGPIGAALLNMAVTGAVISYAIVMIDFVVLRVRRPGDAPALRQPPRDRRGRGRCHSGFAGSGFDPADRGVPYRHDRHPGFYRCDVHLLPRSTAGTTLSPRRPRRKRRWCERRSANSPDPRLSEKPPDHESGGFLIPVVCS